MIGVALWLATQPLFADSFPNIVVNGGFEAGDFSGWTLSGNVASGPVGWTHLSSYGPPYAPHSGNYDLEMGPVGSDGYLSQTLSTIPGALYTVTYWLSNPLADFFGTSPSEFSVSWNGTVIPGSVLINSSGFDFTEFTFTGLTTSSTSTNLQFAFRNDPALYFLDDISVVDPPADRVPEPATIFLLIAALVGTGLRTILRRGRSLPLLSVMQNWGKASRAFPQKV